MFKRSSISLLATIFLGKANAILPIYPAEIIARDLNLWGASWAGHVGITTAPHIAQDAYQVIEVLNDEDPIIRTNLISTFKTITPYWGSRYGISDRGNNALRILREANFQKDLGCATYTIWAAYMPSKGGYEGTTPKPTYCGYFRCDTFVNYTFNWGNYTLPTYNPPGEIAKPTIPLYVFNSFPKGNGDGPYAPESLVPSMTRVISPSMLSINSVDTLQLNATSPEEFALIVDVPKNQITNEGIKNIFKLIEDPLLDSTKRTFLMDKFGFVATVDMIPNLINLYFRLKHNDDELPISKQLIASLQNIYQRYSMLEQYPKERELLVNFYLITMKEALFPVEKAIVIRGLISLSSNQEVQSNLHKIMAKINEQENKLAPSTSLKLQMELFNKSREFEKTIISDIINQLENEKSTELDAIFSEFIVYRLSHLGPNSLLQSSKDEIRFYLDSIKFKFNILNKSDNGLTIFSPGAWLEATALINSNSLKEAGKYIANYIQNQGAEDQKRYIIGLSNTDYMKRAFETEPVLRDFKKHNNALYLDTVGIPQKK